MICCLTAASSGTKSLLSHPARGAVLLDVVRHRAAWPRRADSAYLGKCSRVAGFRSTRAAQTRLTVSSALRDATLLVVAPMSTRKCHVPLPSLTEKPYVDVLVSFV